MYQWHSSKSVQSKQSKKSENICSNFFLQQMCQSIIDYIAQFREATLSTIYRLQLQMLKIQIKHFLA